MNDGTPSVAINLATIGLAIGGPAALFSGLITFVTIPSGVPSALVVVFVSALALTALSAVVYMAERMKAGR